jgi:hypothetical protein
VGPKRAGILNVVALPKDDLWFPEDELDIFVPDDVTSIFDYVHQSPEYAQYCLVLDEEQAYGWAELEIIGRWQTGRRAALETMPYREYLETPEWAGKRVEALVRDGWRCRVCNSSRSLVVHHRSYARRGHERVQDLTVLCWQCHELFHEGGRMPVSD